MSRTLKIFLASSSELVEDRKAFELEIARKNKIWNQKGILLEVVVWEDCLDALAHNRLQDTYNDQIRNCDLFVMLFFSKVGKYTEEEFDTAVGAFKRDQRPLVYTYFKDASIRLAEIPRADIQSVWAFEDKLLALGHFVTRYDNLDKLSLHFGNQLEKLSSDGAFGDAMVGAQLSAVEVPRVTTGTSTPSRAEALKHYIGLYPKWFLETLTRPWDMPLRGPDVFVVLGLSVLIGATVGAAIPGRAELQSRVTVLVVALLLWTFISVCVHGLSRLFGTKATLAETCAGTLQALAVAYVFANFLTLVVVTSRQAYAALDMMLSQVAWFPDKPGELILGIQFIMWLVYLPLVMAGIHRFKGIALLFVSVVGAIAGVLVAFPVSGAGGCAPTVDIHDITTNDVQPTLEFRSSRT